jgi:hypothetical protein
MAKIRTIRLEFLRHGPIHNQLLSPLTQYLGLCGNHGASTVHVPYEHQDFLSLLESLRYRDGGRGNAQRRQLDLNKTAEKMAKILASVPGLVSALGTAHPGETTVTHLELILSASELAMLPFELAKVPRGCAGGEGNRLLLQTLLPICLTRRVRSVSGENLVWPLKPKILFIIGQHRNMPVPAVKHTQALLKAIKPWIPPYDPSTPGDLENKTRQILTILPKATVEQIEAACAENVYTHVHILAHGMEDTTLPGRPYGLALHDSRDESEIEVVSGERLASALRPLRWQDTPEPPGQPHGVFPAVVTVAACDTGYVSSVIYNNGASLAHALHQAGIPFVVASQFPLSKPGSVHVAELLYRRMLWGEDPRITLQHLRSKLHALSADTHDWASLVTYAALPDDLEFQLKDVQYVQAKEAINIAMAYIDRTIDEMKQIGGGIRKSSSEIEQDMESAIGQLEIMVRRVDEAAKRMPTTGEYETEGPGMLASTSKRKAEAYWNASLIGPTDEKRADFSRLCLNGLQEALEYYDRAYHESMRESKGVIRGRRSLHWVMGQYLSLSAVLCEPFLRDHWGAAMVSTQVDLEEGHGEGIVWSHGSSAELYLILLAYDPEEVPIEAEEIRGKTLDHIQSLISLAGHGSFPVYSTQRQFRRYIDWWGHEIFETFLADEGRVRERSWTEPGGVVALADQVVEMLAK